LDFGIRSREIINRNDFGDMCSYTIEAETENENAVKEVMLA